MKTAIIKAESLTRYAQNKMVLVPKKTRETNDDYELRTCRERCHYDKKTREVYIPATVLSLNIKQAAQYLGILVPGKRGATYTKHFNSGVWVTEPLYLGVTVDDIELEEVILPGQPGKKGGPRVLKHMPYIDKWQGQIQYILTDDIIPKDIFLQVLETGSKLIGIGRYRPENKGYYGQFKWELVDWIEA